MTFLLGWLHEQTDNGREALRVYDNGISFDPSYHTYYNQSYIVYSQGLYGIKQDLKKDFPIY